jgi:hypothetical protein
MTVPEQKSVPEPESIRLPHRNVNYLRDPVLLAQTTSKVAISGSQYHDPRELGPRHIRFDYDVDVISNPFINDTTYTVYTPDDQDITIDSADDIPQDYFLPPDGGGQTLLRPFVDPVNKILVTHHFDRKHLTWVRMVTRLRKDVNIPRPPANQFNISPQYYYKSRGNRYVRYKPKVRQIARPRYLSDRIYEGRSGLSGEGMGVGVFNGGFR